MITPLRLTSDKLLLLNTGTVLYQRLSTRLIIRPLWIKLLKKTTKNSCWIEATYQLGIQAIYIVILI
jgi:hypothetical protein